MSLLVIISISCVRRTRFGNNRRAKLAMKYWGNQELGYWRIGDLDMKQIIDPDAFNRSIALAFASSFDVDAALRRVKKIIAALPAEKLFLAHHNGWISFYKRVDGKQCYLPKRSEEIYLLARRRYLLLQLDILELTGRRDGKYPQIRDDLIKKLQELINEFARGNLDIARIVMTTKQYKWYTRSFKQKEIDKSISYRSLGGVYVRSKSERDIMNRLAWFAVPTHYEEETSIQVQPLVDALYHELRESGELNGNLFYYRNGACRWRVPARLAWMNASGSIWATYNYKTGKLTIFDDFRIMLSSNELIGWEHHGMCSDFTYRINAGERMMILKFSRTFLKDNLIETFEDDVDSPDKISETICTCILPRLWF